MAQETLALPVACQETQNQFLGCLAGYIGAKYMMYPESDYEATMLLAKKILMILHQYVQIRLISLMIKRLLIQGTKHFHSGYCKPIFGKFHHGKKPLPKAL